MIVKALKDRVRASRRPTKKDSRGGIVQPVHPDRFRLKE
jgi:hypothetical protein